MLLKLNETCQDNALIRLLHTYVYNRADIRYEERLLLLLIP